VIGAKGHLANFRKASVDHSGCCHLKCAVYTVTKPIVSTSRYVPAHQILGFVRAYLAERGSVVHSLHPIRCARWESRVSMRIVWPLCSSLSSLGLCLSVRSLHALSDEELDARWQKRCADEAAAKAACLAAAAASSSSTDSSASPF